MRYPQIIVLLLLFASLFMGCDLNDSAGINQDTNLEIRPSVTRLAVKPDEQVTGTAEPNGVLSLRQMLALTLMNNPELKVFSLETRAAQARQLQAGLWPNPELGVELEDVGGSGPRSGFDAAETTIQLRQLIELGDKAQKRQKVASLEKELSDWDYEAKRVEILTEAGKAYFELLAAQEKAGLLAEMIGISEQIVNSVSQRVEAGKDSPLEKTRASVVFRGVQFEHKQALLELEKARKTAASFWAGQTPRFIRAEGQLETVTEIPDVNDLQQMISHNPRLARWEKEIAHKKAAVELEKTKGLSDISVSAGFRRFNETDDNAFIFGVAIPLPISDRNQGSRMEAAINLSRSYQEQRAAHIELMNQFNEVYSRLSISLNKAKEFQTSILPGAKEVLAASRTAYAEGKIDFLNVLDAQRSCFVSQTEYLEALVSYHKAKADMEGLTGQSIDKEEQIQRQ